MVKTLYKWDSSNFHFTFAVISAEKDVTLQPKAIAVAFLNIQRTNGFSENQSYL